MFRQILSTAGTLSFLVLTALPAPAQVQMQVNMPMPTLEIRVGHSAPPPLRHEHRPSSPGHGYMWVPGSWDWQRNDWNWMPGRWDRPVEAHASWVKARYVREGPAWRYEPGHWSNQRVIEGDDYRHWKEENGGKHKHDKKDNHGQDKKHDQHRDRR